MKTQYTQAEMKVLQAEAMTLRDQLCLAEQAAEEAGNVERYARLRTLSWAAMGRWYRRDKAARHAPAWEYGLEGDAASIWDDLMRGYRVDVIGQAPFAFTIAPEFGVFYRLIPAKRSARAKTVMFADKWELATWVGCLTLPAREERVAA